MIDLAKTIFATILLTAAITTATATASDYPWAIAHVIDGDTVAVDASANMPVELANLKVRLRGVDTPEIGHRAECEAERNAADAATAFTKERIASAQTVVVRNPEWGTWGGRVIADLVLDGESLSSALINEGHGRPYDGGRRQGWCP